MCEDVGLQDNPLHSWIGNMQAALELCLRKQSFTRSITVRDNDESIHVVMLGYFDL